MLDLSDFKITEPKFLHVFLLLDVSGSMSGSKIQNLNEAVSVMIREFSNLENSEKAIKVTIITFGGEARLNFPPTRASEVIWTDLGPAGGTPMGSALKLARTLIEDNNIVKKRDYRPVVVLVSDGQPTDEWKSPLKEFINGGRTSKCERMAIAIGRDADEGILNKFLEGSGHSLMYAADAQMLHEHFRFITMSVSQRQRSKDPNAIPPVSNAVLDGGTVNHGGTQASGPKDGGGQPSGNASYINKNNSYW
jgi:uncharacterized protein YegL